MSFFNDHEHIKEPIHLIEETFQRLEELIQIADCVFSGDTQMESLTNLEHPDDEIDQKCGIGDGILMKLAENENLQRNSVDTSSTNQVSAG